MAGRTGPVPKREEARIRRNKDEAGPVEKLNMVGDVEVPELGYDADGLDDRSLHPIAVDLYNSLKDSGQSRYYEPSDWEMARVLCHLLSKVLWSSKPSAQMLAALNSLMSSLLLTEGERRRVRLEVERGQVEAQVVDIAKVLEERMRGLKAV